MQWLPGSLFPHLQRQGKRLDPSQRLIVIHIQAGSSSTCRLHCCAHRHFLRCDNHTCICCVDFVENADRTSFAEHYSIPHTLISYQCKGETEETFFHKKGVKVQQQFLQLDYIIADHRKQSTKLFALSCSISSLTSEVHVLHHYTNLTVVCA